MDRIRESMVILRQTAETLSAHARAMDLKNAQHIREVAAKDLLIADLEQRLILHRALAGLSARQKDVQGELVDLAERLRKSTENAAKWEQAVIRMEQDRDQWESLYRVCQNSNTVIFAAGIYELDIPGNGDPPQRVNKRHGIFELARGRFLVRADYPGYGPLSSLSISATTRYPPLCPRHKSFPHPGRTGEVVERALVVRQPRIEEYIYLANKWQRVFNLACLMATEHSHLCGSKNWNQLVSLLTQGSSESAEKEEEDCLRGPKLNHNVLERYSRPLEIAYVSQEEAQIPFYHTINRLILVGKKCGSSYTNVRFALAVESSDRKIPSTIGKLWNYKSKV
ncbi:hypothetical protein C8R44DRAFT_903690 [Mycena epipterygia]|nr:hypothetical protein C8R44DRAFT_903690 [Mycena epipterygia]